MNKGAKIRVVHVVSMSEAGVNHARAARRAHWSHAALSVMRCMCTCSSLSRPRSSNSSTCSTSQHPSSCGGNHQGACTACWRSAGSHPSRHPCGARGRERCHACVLSHARTCMRAKKVKLKGRSMKMDHTTVCGPANLRAIGGRATTSRRRLAWPPHPRMSVQPCCAGQPGCAAPGLLAHRRTRLWAPQREGRAPSERPQQVGEEPLNVKELRHDDQVERRQLLRAQRRPAR